MVTNLYFDRVNIPRGRGEAKGPFASLGQNGGFISTVPAQIPFSELLDKIISEDFSKPLRTIQASITAGPTLAVSSTAEERTTTLTTRGKLLLQAKIKKLQVCLEVRQRRRNLYARGSGT